MRYGVNVKNRYSIKNAVKQDGNAWLDWLSLLTENVEIRTSLPEEYRELMKQHYADLTKGYQRRGQEMNMFLYGDYTSTL